MRRDEAGTGKLMQLCLAYFFFYVVTGVTVKYFLGKPDLGFPGMKESEFLAYSTLGGTFLCLLVVISRRWYKSKSTQTTTLAGIALPKEYLYIIPSGICTAVVIPTTTLMYTLPISIMVAMVIMRASVIVISRIVDAIQIHQGILRKRVYAEENLGVVFALMAAGANLLYVKKGDFDFLHSLPAITILGSYVLAYAIRIYIMNYYKNTRPQGVPLDNKWFFAIEQIGASTTLALAAILVFYSPTLWGWTNLEIGAFQKAITNPHPSWIPATGAGLAYGMVAFFSVFIFMFKGRTATFAGLVNRLTSLIAGTTATLVFALAFGGKFPKTQDWISLAFILIAVACLTRAERKRAAELALSSKEGAAKILIAHEIEVAQAKLLSQESLKN